MLTPHAALVLLGLGCLVLAIDLLFRRLDRIGRPKGLRKK